MDIKKIIVHSFLYKLYRYKKLYFFVVLSASFLYLAINRKYGITVGPFTRYSMYAEKYELADSTHFYYLGNRVANNFLRYRVPDLVQVQVPIINEPAIPDSGQNLTVTNDSLAKQKAKKNLARYYSGAYQIKGTEVVIREAIIVWNFKAKSFEIKYIY